MRQISSLLFGLLALLIVGSSAAQSNYPEKPIRVVVGFPPGSRPDIVARLLGQKLTEVLGKPVVVENIAGAAGNIAAERVAKAAPDGYTLGLAANAQIIINPSLYKLPFDPVKDFDADLAGLCVAEPLGRPQRGDGEERPGVARTGQSTARRAHLRLRRQR